MAVSESKELIQCLAFAYFAENTVVNDEHEQDWFDIFDPRTKTSKTALKSKYGKYLSTNFDFDKTLKEHLSEVSEKGTIKRNPRLIKVYLVAKKLVESNILKTQLNQYRFLDQNDKFVQTVKDDCLGRIVKTFKLPLKPDILSPADLFMVKRTQQSMIEKEFKDNILKVSDEKLLENMSWGSTGKNTYRTISNKYFKDRDLIGISLKLPEQVTAPKTIKIVGTVDIDKDALDFVDPYTKFLSALVANKSKNDDLIEKVVDIEFDNFRISDSLLSWEYPITFRYSEVMDPRSAGNMPLHKKNLRFKLFTWSSAGFNAQWYPNQGQPGNWTGGAGIKPTEQLLVRYNEYPSILNDLIDIREEAFYLAVHNKKTAPKIPTQNQTEYKAALGEVKGKKILTQSDMKKILKFFETYSSKVQYIEFQRNLIRLATKDMKTSGEVSMDEKRVYAHFIASQCAWFLFRGGKKMHTHIKQRIFLSIYGLITKSGYKIFQGGSNTVLENFVMTKFIKNKKEVEAYFNAAPHIVLS